MLTTVYYVVIRFCFVRISYDQNILNIHLVLFIDIQLPAISLTEYCISRPRENYRLWIVNWILHRICWRQNSMWHINNTDCSYVLYKSKSAFNHHTYLDSTCSRHSERRCGMNARGGCCTQGCRFGLSISLHRQSTHKYNRRDPCMGFCTHHWLNGALMIGWVSQY